MIHTYADKRSAWKKFDNENIEPRNVTNWIYQIRKGIKSRSWPSHAAETMINRFSPSRLNATSISYL